MSLGWNLFVSKEDTVIILSISLSPAMRTNWYKNGSVWVSWVYSPLTSSIVPEVTIYSLLYTSMNSDTQKAFWDIILWFVHGFLHNASICLTILPIIDVILVFLYDWYCLKLIYEPSMSKLEEHSCALMSKAITSELLSIHTVGRRVFMGVKFESEHVQNEIKKACLWEYGGFKIVWSLKWSEITIVDIYIRSTELNLKLALKIAV